MLLPERLVEPVGQALALDAAKRIEVMDSFPETVGGKILYYNVAWYRPRPLIARSNEWISPQVVALRDVSAPHLAEGIKMGHDVTETLKAIATEQGEMSFDQAASFVSQLSSQGRFIQELWS